MKHMASRCYVTIANSCTTFDSDSVPIVSCHAAHISSYTAHYPLESSELVIHLATLHWSDVAQIGHILALFDPTNHAMCQ